MVNIDAPLRQQLLNIAVREAEAEVPAHRHHNRLDGGATSSDDNYCCHRKGPGSARRHGISDDDIRHAVHNAMVAIGSADQPEFTMLVGPDICDSSTSGVNGHEDEE